jgi:hypothetical protein
VTSSTDVRFWDVRRKRWRNVVAYEVRWVVAGRQRSRSRRTKELAESFLADLRQAARKGEPFDLATGLPLSLIQTTGPTWLQFVQHYIDAKWPHAAAKTRDSLTDALATVTAALVNANDSPHDTSVLRVALRQYLLPPAQREAERPAEMDQAVRWLTQTPCHWPNLPNPGTCAAR